MCLNARLRGVKVDADSAIPLVLERWEAEDEGTEEPAETPSPSLPFPALSLACLPLPACPFHLAVW